MSSERIGLAWKFCVSPDSCENPEYYEQFIRLVALSDAKSGQAVTHILIDTEKARIAGYVALRATSIVSKDSSGNGTVHPAIEIAELAVDKDYERLGVGRELFGLAILLASKTRKEIGVRSVLVCADPQAVGFYTKLGFAQLSSLYSALRDGWNVKCEPMYIAFPEE